MSKIKVLHIHTLPVISGSGINTFLTMDRLDKDKYEVEFACKPGGKLIELVRERGIVFRPVNHFVMLVSPFNDLAALFELIFILRRNKYDIVHTHNSKAGFIGRLAAKIAGITIIVHTIHGFAFHDFEKPPRQKLFILLEKLAACFADKLITVSRSLKDWGLSLGIGKENQYVTIYDGIEIDKFNSGFNIEKKKQELGIEPEDFVIGVVSKLWEGKGHGCIIKAAKMVAVKIPRVKFIFVGEGYLRQKLEELTKRSGLDKHIIFAGFRSDIPEITSTFDVAILVSLFEGLGRVLLEAMAAAKVVIATKIGGIVDIVDDGQTGILIKPEDHQALAEAIVKLLLDNGLRIKMGQAGRRKIDTKFSAKTMVNRIDEVYRELVVKKAFPRRSARR